VKVSGVPYDQGKHPQGRLDPTAGILHRTYGLKGRDTYNGAYSIGKNGRSGVGIGFHFLIGKNEGQWVQFYETTTKAAHAKGANDWAVGIEFDGVNEDVLTDWQVKCGAHIISRVSAAHGIPLSYYDGPRKRVAGWLNHASVPGSDHTDLVTTADWARMAAMWGTPQAPPTITGDPMSYRMRQHHTGDVWLYEQDGASLERVLVSATSDPRPGHVKALQDMGVPLEGLPNAIRSQVLLDVTRAI
jgi:hypothetical protein